MPEPTPTYERIRPRELKPALLELAWISRTSVEAHYMLYEGYVKKRTRSLEASTADPVDQFSRELKVELAFAVGGIKNHEIYFEHLGGEGGDPDGRGPPP